MSIEFQAKQLKRMDVDPNDFGVNALNWARAVLSDPDRKLNTAITSLKIHRAIMRKLHRLPDVEVELKTLGWERDYVEAESPDEKLDPEGFHTYARRFYSFAHSPSLIPNLGEVVAENNDDDYAYFPRSIEEREQEMIELQSIRWGVLKCDWEPGSQTTSDLRLICYD